MEIVSLNIGQPENLFDSNNESYISGVRKTPTSESIDLKYDGLVGDSSYEECHGTNNMSLHIFSFEHYDFFNQKIDFKLPIPAFGENLTVKGMLEAEMNVGDILEIGSATVQVSQPTERCKTLGKSLGLPKMLKWIHEEMMTGFYVRVLNEGTISSSANIKLVDRGPDHLNLAKLNHLLFKDLNRSQLELVLESPLLSTDWKERAKVLYSRSGI